MGTSRIYDLEKDNEYYTTSDCLTIIDKKQYDMLIDQFNKRKNKDETKFNLKKNIPKNKKKKTGLKNIEKLNLMEILNLIKLEF